MATQSEKPLFVQQLEAYDALIPLKPEGWGEIRKKDKLSGLIEESKLAEILDHITQRDDLEKMMKAIVLMTPKMQNRQTVCDFISYGEDGCFVQALEAAQIDIKIERERELSTNGPDTPYYYRLGGMDVHIENLLRFIDLRGRDDPWLDHLVAWKKAHDDAGSDADKEWLRKAELYKSEAMLPPELKTKGYA